MGGNFMGGASNKTGQLAPTQPMTQNASPQESNANLFNSGNSFQNVQNRRLASNPIIQGLRKRRFI